jgi:hypothetical protein
MKYNSVTNYNTNLVSDKQLNLFLLYRKYRYIFVA